MSLSKNELKLITSLQQKKIRQKHRLFIAEGIKTVTELLTSSFDVDTIYTVEKLDIDIPDNQLKLISEVDLKKISNLKTPNKVLGLFRIPDEISVQQSGLIVALDGLNDPGNLGTIIRLCDWFGVKQLICSPNTVDCFNPKVVQASMGSITRVQINYLELQDFLKDVNSPIYCANMNGDNIYKHSFPADAVIIMGNEANGISKTIEEIVANKITIPRFGEFNKTESLNVATATAILLSEFRR